MPLYYTADSTCDICFETFADPTAEKPDFDLLPSIVNCGHVFCRSCLYNVRAPGTQSPDANCPQCRVKFKFADVRRLHIDRAPPNSTALPASIIEQTASAGLARHAKGANAPTVLDKTLWATLLRHEKRRRQDEHEARGTSEPEPLFEARCLLQAATDRAIYDDRASQALKHMLWRTRDHLAELDKHSISAERERGYVRLVHALAALTDYCMNKEAEAQHYAIKLLLTEREAKRSVWLIDMFAEKLGHLQVQTGHRKEWNEAMRKEYMHIWRTEAKKRLTPTDEVTLAEGASVDTNTLHMRRGVPANYTVSLTEGLLLYPQQHEFGLEPTRAQRPPHRQVAVDRQEAERKREAERAARQPTHRLDNNHASYPWYICDTADETIRQRAEARVAVQPSAAPARPTVVAQPHAPTSRATSVPPRPAPAPHVEPTVRGRDAHRPSMPRPGVRAPSIHEQLAARSRRMSDSRPMTRRTRIDSLAGPAIVDVHAAPRRAPHPYPRPSRAANTGA